jgi:hypothetical protein
LLKECVGLQNLWEARNLGVESRQHLRELKKSRLREVLPNPGQMRVALMPPCLG